MSTFEELMKQAPSKAKLEPDSVGEFGLSPSARTKVGVSHPRTRPPDELEKMLDTYDPDEYDFLDDMAD
jgi:hypothetical protein